MSFLLNHKSTFENGFLSLERELYNSRDAQKGFVGGWRFWVVLIIENPCVNVVIIRSDDIPSYVGFQHNSQTSQKTQHKDYGDP